MPGGLSRAAFDLTEPLGHVPQPTSWAPDQAPIVLIPGFGAPSVDEAGGDVMRPTSSGGWWGDASASGEDMWAGASFESRGHRISEACPPAQTAGPRGLWYKYWGEAASLSSFESPILTAWPAGFASLHDRACEVFAQIKGGVVDYGKEHAERCGHARYGRSYEGLFRHWDADNPVHLVGHSLGGTTARMLQHLLSTGHFEGHDTSADWVCSLTAINAPLNGSPVTYALGLRSDGTSDVRPLSCGWLLGRAVHLAGFVGVPLFGYDVGMEQWELAWWHPGSARKLLASVVGRSGMVEGGDNAAYDSSVHAMRAWNAEMGPGHEGTYYFSFAGTSEVAADPPPSP
eukprot:CAMPEP_0173456758 /NCGR_PEP_ID=MMETSP1357-20121228/56524_1 /TAXON_ID=77926 /ORGANISM="Hemiselmis rufescens, Strain PCC563" /LENGTH=343 /DNA_ID=CAMNT_0014424005 /DNA_START=149 /DNA_END=1176 /DNA_ORIENTATION=+